MKNIKDNNYIITAPQLNKKITTAYIHVPFCKSKCFYCDFNSYSMKENLIENYFDSLIEEIKIVYNYYKNNSNNNITNNINNKKCNNNNINNAIDNNNNYNNNNNNYYIEKLDSVFFGGGTPSYVPSKYIVKVINTLKDTFGLADNYEMTIECNPGTIDFNKMSDYKKNGINRLSIGLQTTNDKLLKELGRIHNYDEFEKCINLADALELSNRNIDLMFGLPHQTIKDIKDSIEIILSKNPTHISFYSLILEEGTPFYDKFHNNTSILPSDLAERKMYWTAIREFENKGFLHYEISNLAKPGFYCRQNKVYWESNEYYGFGAGAHSYQNSYRIENEIEIENYIRKITANKVPENSPAGIESILITSHEKQKEFFLLGFRLMKGIDINEFNIRFPDRQFDFIPILDDLVNRGLLKIYQNKYLLTKKGIDFANQVFMEFV